MAVLVNDTRSPDRAGLALLDDLSNERPRRDRVPVARSAWDRVTGPANKLAGEPTPEGPLTETA